MEIRKTVMTILYAKLCAILYAKLCAILYAKETQMLRTDFWTMREKVKGGMI